MNKTFLQDPWFQSILPMTREKFPRRFDIIFGELEKLNYNYYYMIETGCVCLPEQFHWQGCFSIQANHFLNYYDGILLTCNIDQYAIDICKPFNKIEATLMDSIEFLNSSRIKLLINSVSLFYLDSFDLDIHNPEPSMQHHFNEFKAIIQNRTKGNFFLCIDDNYAPSIQKGHYINQLMKEKDIKDIINDYQSMYWIDDFSFQCLASSLN